VVGDRQDIVLFRISFLPDRLRASFIFSKFLL
jgi:hypothetical protein